MNTLWSIYTTSFYQSSRCFCLMEYSIPLWMTLNVLYLDTVCVFIHFNRQTSRLTSSVFKYHLLDSTTISVSFDILFSCLFSIFIYDNCHTSKSKFNDPLFFSVVWCIMNNFVSINCRRKYHQKNTQTISFESNLCVKDCKMHCNNNLTLH